MPIIQIKIKINSGKVLESNIEDIQRSATKIGKPLLGQEIDVFA